MISKTQLANPKFYIMLFADVLIFCLSLILAYLFRFDFSIPQEFSAQLFKTLPITSGAKLFFFFLFGLYRGMWRYTSVSDFWRLLQAIIFSQITIVAFIGFLYHFHGYLRSVFLLDGLIAIVLTGGMRLSIRSFYSSQDFPFAWTRSFFLPFGGEKHGKPVIIIGAGDAGEKVAREILENGHKPYFLVGFVDDDERKIGRLVHGVPVLGKVEDLPQLIQKHGVEEVLIAIPSASGRQMRRIVRVCDKADIKFKTLPGLKDLIDGKVSIKALRDVSYEDLLGRPQVKLDSQEISAYLKDKVVLVTGAGGSIGSELCRQIIRFEPDLLILVDSGEANLYSIQMELHHEYHFTSYRTVLAQVQDKELMERTFANYSPQVVFHAAAYKHVPMLEISPWQAVYNNILATKTIMEVAVGYKTERFVLVSTDKAVRPTNVMGASKRVTELLMHTFKGGYTRFMAVRFGNVVGSSGSVIPLFRRQIEKGGPVTVTHPEVTRYFMTIPEAAQLILQAGSMGEGGEIFILEMGTPVRIADMARDLIRLCGKEPDKDIEIVFTGLRPGEKLYEELITEGEGIVSTWHEKIMVLKPETEDIVQSIKDREWLIKQIEELLYLARRFDGGTIKMKLKEIVPEYEPKETESVV
ncbi:polysaccharide biosynthesis protein [Desulfovulcanus sp.]